jgi:hypothetical protein
MSENQCLYGPYNPPALRDNAPTLAWRTEKTPVARR